MQFTPSRKNIAVLERLRSKRRSLPQQFGANRCKQVKSVRIDIYRSILSINKIYRRTHVVQFNKGLGRHDLKPQTVAMYEH